MTELFNGGGTGITSDDNSFLFELLSLLLNYRLSGNKTPVTTSTLPFKNPCGFPW